MVLYVNCCARNESRTDRLARALLEKIGDKYDTLSLYEEDLNPLTEQTLAHRNELLAKGNYSSPIFRYAKQFAQAELIVLAAPFWDLSFPSMLKVYIENIYVMGIVSRYRPDGKPEGMCKAKKLYYVTTAGGPYQPEYSFGYIQALATQFWGIKEVELIMAEMLDVDGFCAEDIIRQAINHI